MGLSPTPPLAVGGRKRVLESASPLHVVVTQRQREAVRTVSARLGLSQSELVRDALDNYFDGVGKVG